jgi:fatty acid desaturase
MLNDNTIYRREIVSNFRARPSAITFSLKLIVYLFLISLGALVASASSWAIRPFGIILLGLVFAHGVELQHEALHNLGFRSRRLNEIVGVLLGLPMLVSFAAYQASHMRHHRYLGTPENKEFFDYGDQYGGSRRLSLPSAVQRFLMLKHFAAVARNLLALLLHRDIAGEAPPVAARIRRDHSLMLAAAALLAVSGWALGNGFLIYVWLLPLLAVAAPTHALIELPEHFRCNTRSADVFENTRTIKSNMFLTWFTNANNFHVEHHLWPTLPIERLPDLHERIAPRLKNYERGYWAFFKSSLRTAGQQPSKQSRPQAAEAAR